MSESVVIDNPKEHFILRDSLSNISHDVTYSVFKKYNCKAGCQICYIKNDFLSDEKFKKYIPITTALSTQSYTDKLMNFFSYFNMAATIDDMWFVRQEHPMLYRFYQEFGAAFFLSSMTDNAIFRHLSTIEDGVVFQGIREISVSEQFLYSVNVNKLLNSFDRIHKKAQIMKVKAIISGGNSDQQQGLALAKWCDENNVLLQKQIEYGVGVEAGNSVLAAAGNARFSDNSEFSEETTYHEQVNDIYPIHSEALFLMYDDFYSELKSATAEGYSQPFATLDDFADPIKFLPKIIAGKVNDYRRYVTAIQNKDNVYYKYFKYVVDNLVINKDFNFIPRVSFQPFTTYHRKIVESGEMVDTSYGLVDPNAKVIVPIYTFKNHEPQQISNS